MMQPTGLVSSSSNTTLQPGMMATTTIPTIITSNQDSQNMMGVMMSNMPNSTNETQSPQTLEKNLERLLALNPLEIKDEFEEKMFRWYLMVQNHISGKSEHQIHEELSRMCRESSSLSEEVICGLIVSMLLDFHNSHRLFIPIILSNRDGVNQLSNFINQILMDKFHRLHEHSRQRLLLLLKELLRNPVGNIDSIYYNLLRNIVSGDTSAKNLSLAETVLDILIDHRFSYDSNLNLIQYALVKYLRLIADHINPQHQRLLIKEIRFCHCLLVERFADFIMIGRDLVRLLQQVCRVGEFDQLWKTIFTNPASLAPKFHLIQMLKIRTPRRFIKLLISFDVERKLNFLVSHVRLGAQRRYQDWFQRQHLNCPENQMLRTDMIRFICNSIHPSNEVIASDLVPRWAVIGWILNSCPHQVTMSWSRLALFYDWLMFDMNDTSNNLIMDLEPGLLVMYLSLKNYSGITTALLDFLCRISMEFCPSLTHQIKKGIVNAFAYQVEKRVIPTLAHMFDPAKIDQQLRQLFNKTFPELQPLVDSVIGYQPISSIIVPSINAQPQQQPTSGGVYMLPNGYSFNTQIVPSTNNTTTTISSPCSSSALAATSCFTSNVSITTENNPISLTSPAIITAAGGGASSSSSTIASASSGVGNSSDFDGSKSVHSSSTTAAPASGASNSSTKTAQQNSSVFNYSNKTSQNRLLSNSAGVVVVSASHAAMATMAATNHSLLTPHTNPILTTNPKSINVVNKQTVVASTTGTNNNSPHHAIIQNQHQTNMLPDNSMDSVSGGLHTNLAFASGQQQIMITTPTGSTASKFSDDEDEEYSGGGGGGSSVGNSSSSSSTILNNSNHSGGGNAGGKVKLPSTKKLKKSNSSFMSSTVKSATLAVAPTTTTKINVPPSSSLNNNSFGSLGIISPTSMTTTMTNILTSSSSSSTQVLAPSSSASSSNSNILSNSNNGPSSIIPQSSGMAVISPSSTLGSTNNNNNNNNSSSTEFIANILNSTVVNNSNQQQQQTSAQLTSVMNSHHHQSQQYATATTMLVGSGNVNNNVPNQNNNNSVSVIMSSQTSSSSSSPSAGISMPNINNSNSIGLSINSMIHQDHHSVVSTNNSGLSGVGISKHELINDGNENDGSITSNSSSANTEASYRPYLYSIMDEKNDFSSSINDNISSTYDCATNWRLFQNRSDLKISPDEIGESIDKIDHDGVRCLIQRFVQDRDMQSQCEVLEKLVKQLSEIEEDQNWSFLKPATIVLASILDENMSRRRFPEYLSHSTQNWLHPNKRLLQSSIDGPVFVLFRALADSYSSQEESNKSRAANSDPNDDEIMILDKKETILHKLIGEIWQKNPRIGFLLLHYLVVSEKTFNNMQIYKDMLRIIGKRITVESIIEDMAHCFAHDYFMFIYILPAVIKSFQSILVGNIELIRLILDHVDYIGIGYLVTLIQRDQLNLFVEEHFQLQSILNFFLSDSSPQFDYVQLQLLWQLMDAHDFELDTYLCVFSARDEIENNQVTLHYLFEMFKRQSPTEEYLKKLFNREQNKLADRFVINVLMYWAKYHEENLAYLVGNYVSTMISSPNKRNKRALNNASKSQINKTTHVEHLLFYLDEMRKGSCPILRQELFIVILVQLQQICNGPQKIKYSKLFAHVPDDNDSSNNNSNNNGKNSHRKNSSGFSGSSISSGLLSSSSASRKNNRNKLSSSTNNNNNNKDSATESDSSEENVPLKKIMKSNLRNKKRKQPASFDSD